MASFVISGGGNTACGETKVFDYEIIRLSGKGAPHVLFICLPSRDPEKTYSSLKKIYCDGYGCSTDHLS